MSAGKYSFVLEQGSTFQKTLVYKTNSGAYYDLTGYSARTQIRPTKDSQTILWSGDTNDGGLNITVPVSGTIVFTIPADSSASMSFSEAVYDIEIYSGSFVSRIIEGNVKLSKEVTR